MEEETVSLLYLIIGLLVVAVIVSLILSFLGILLVGALRLLPIVFAALLLFVVLGKAKSGLSGSDDSRSRR